MSLRVVLLSYRKPDIPPEEFKAHYDGTHVPLMKSLLGPLFPLSHTRRYIQRILNTGNSANLNTQYPATVLSGAQADFGFDAVTEMVFEDQDTFQKFTAACMAPEVAEKVREDCEKFLDLERGTPMVVLSGCEVTTRV
ncbi:hypothetical protein FQN55_003744 [Onygenales sp. PD_40]|nr:hypothetical protein FQN55_003744 [Onygenales sp. PD_40]